MTLLRTSHRHHRLRAALAGTLLATVLAGPGILWPQSAPAASSSPRAIYRLLARDLKDPRPIFALGLDVAGYGPNGSIDVILTEDERAKLRSLGVEPVPLEFLTRGLRTAAQSPLLAPNLGDYHTVAETHAALQALVAAHPTLAMMDTIGTSIEGRPIEALRISDNVGVPEGEPEALVVGCHHARELMSVELPLYVATRLLDGYGSDPVITALVNGRDIWVVPMLNPDGHQYMSQNTQGQSDNWWRKNRRINGDGSFGVDLNRNYGYLWGFDNVGSSPLTTSEVYRGTGPFSEPETAALRAFMAAHSFTVSLSYHSYGELLLFPWGYATLDTPDHDVFQALGDSMGVQNGYLVGNPKSGAIYLTNGGMDDWVYGETAEKPRVFGFTFEVNRAEQGGFAPSDNLIVPTCELNWGPTLTLLRYADAPRRVLGPARPSAPTYAAQLPGIRVSWTYPVPDPPNEPVRHDLRRVDSLFVGVDNAEAGTAAWDTTLFAWTTARSKSGVRSFWSGSGNNRVSILRSRAGHDVAVSESLNVQAFWDLESDLDYWYAEASNDGGKTWAHLPGNRSALTNPFGRNEGNGVTGSSGGQFLEAAFSMAPLTGTQVLVRFRCVTDGSVAGEGVYLDDIAPTDIESSATLIDTQSATTSYDVVPLPTKATWFQARAVDSEGQVGAFGPRSRYDPSLTGAVVPVPVIALDRIHPNVPNPFNPRTTVRYDLAVGKPGPFALTLCDVSGRRVAVLARGWDEGRGATREAAWDGRTSSGADAASGIYVLVLECVRGTVSRKVALLR